MPTLNLGRVRFNWKGAYDPLEPYLEYDCVEDDGQSYVCIAPVTGTGPNDTGGSTYWESMLVRSADYNQARQDAIDAAAAADDSATSAANSATTAGNAKTAAETARDKSQAWAEGTEPEPGKKSSREWAEEAASFGDPNLFDITADQTADTRTMAEWAAQAKVNQGKLATAYRLGNGAYATDSGAADAYVLSVNYADAAPTAYNDGDQYRFRAGAANTGASTVSVNGLGAKTLVTVTGVALPAGYIRTDADTTITYDAANDRFVADREVEPGSNSNGEYARHADGRAEIILRVLISLNDSGFQLFTLPVALDPGSTVGGGILFDTLPESAPANADWWNRLSRVVAAVDPATWSGSEVRVLFRPDSDRPTVNATGYVRLRIEGYWYQ
ncbi:hypothetical protein [Halomonas koreensis]|uniref:Tail fiber protein n=1 Tax=Halomonas koreensis TaxID=245385 RepID=A0ABU1G4U3_9GAMM|nr:hypothetical protein [Halomonas koreensis]MDR5867924.1 hypothetical protein [Halomonas koreensis]